MKVVELRRRASVVKVVLPDGKRLSFVIDEADDASLARGRARWIEFKAQGAVLEYWRRGPDGSLYRAD